LGLAVDLEHFLGRAVELQQAFADRTALLYPMPHAVGGETAVALVNEGALKALPTLGFGEALEPILCISGMNRQRQPAAEKKERDRAHVTP